MQRWKARGKAADGQGATIAAKDEAAHTSISGSAEPVVGFSVFGVLWVAVSFGNAVGAAPEPPDSTAEAPRAIPIARTSRSAWRHAIVALQTRQGQTSGRCESREPLRTVGNSTMEKLPRPALRPLWRAQHLRSVADRVRTTHSPTRPCCAARSERVCAPGCALPPSTAVTQRQMTSRLFGWTHSQQGHSQSRCIKLQPPARHPIHRTPCLPAARRAAADGASGTTVRTVELRTTTLQPTLMPDSTGRYPYPPLPMSKFRTTNTPSARASCTASWLRQMACPVSE